MTLIHRTMILFSSTMLIGTESCPQEKPPQLPADKYIIEFNPPDNPTEAINSRAYADRVRAELISTHGFAGRRVQETGTLPYMIVTDMTPEERERWEADPRVKKIHDNVFRDIHTEQSLAVIEQPKAFEWGATGMGYSVAILDTGVEFKHPDFGSCEQPGPNCRVIHSQDFATDDGQPDADKDKHGTNVSAIVAKVAPLASVISLDVFEDAGAADSDVIEALNWVIENRQKYNIVAVNMSLGSDEEHVETCANTVYDSAFEWLLLAGIQVVVAAGNENSKTGLSNPACHPLAISVGASTDGITPSMRYPSCTDPQLAVDEVACFSNSASTIDILAPGTRITAGGVTLSGTSQAAPHVAGALAALKSKFPDSTNAALLRRLQQTGVKIVDRANGIPTRRLNLASAINEPPIAADDKVVALQGGGVVIDVLENDDDANKSALTIESPIKTDAGHALVANNRIYLLLDPAAVGTRQFTYTIKDEYNVLDVAIVTVDIRPSAQPSARRVSEEMSYISRLGRTAASQFLVYETGNVDDRKVWYQALDPSGQMSEARYMLSGTASAKIQPNDLVLQSDHNGFTAAWIGIDYSGKNHIVAVNNDPLILGKPYPASGNYQSQVNLPTVTLLGDTAVIGWEGVSSPSQLMAQASSRETVSPVPYWTLQQLSSWVSSSDHIETVPADESQYIQLRTMTSKKGIEARKLNARGRSAWDAKVLDLGIGEQDHIPDFSSIRTNNGFAAAYTYAPYVGQYAIGLREFDTNANPVGQMVKVLPAVQAQADIDLLRFEDGTYRVFWSERHQNFAVLLSAAVDTNGNVSAAIIEFWTLQPEAFWPYAFEALSLGNKYVLSWSNNARNLTISARERF